MEKAEEDSETKMAVTDFMSVGAFSEAAARKPAGFKILFGLEFPMRENGKEFHVTALAGNGQGLGTLHRISSVKEPIGKAALALMRRGLFIGSACDEGELYQALLCGKGDEELVGLASFYDYIEVQPPENFEFLIEQGKIRDRKTLTQNVKKLVRLGTSVSVPVVAVGDVCFLNREDGRGREKLLKKKGIEGAYARAPLYFRTTREMLDEFSFLARKPRRGSS